ncbi:hypothetical protein F0L68_08235 [Solihabitans fulvus]|uniref:Uncharacterized protein n=1 Tax=Solihabitans fulvus TaxID=1892852 RepID=A0A5B2XKD2_9PSEU|nr:hypothetical protein [Solihabitans fulvus]KAA2264217.1 hypothetical protein F0L68_08235 [Solihabitans fulvus]
MSGWDLEVLAASLRRDSDDLSLYAGFLINTLSASLPAELVSVDRKSGLFGRVRDDAPVLGVTILLGDRRFTLNRTAVGQPVTSRIRHESGGVVLRTETVGMDVWSLELATALARYAQANAAASQVLRRLASPELP